MYAHKIILQSASAITRKSFHGIPAFSYLANKISSFSLLRESGELQQLNLRGMRYSKYVRDYKHGLLKKGGR